uniref:PGG domain-containing protein n=1 Tax=Aegilops tauschii subsp. strangulata TaxID=200361 RepID=A0A453D2Q5_AEGTS
MHSKRYKAFYHCNTAAFVASVVVIIIVQSRQLSAVGRAALKTAMILDLFSLMGAYVAGSCREKVTTIYVAALAVAVFVYSIAKVVAFTAQGQTQPGSESEGKHTLEENLENKRVILEKKSLERKRKFLLQLAILAATVTYQTGLNPPGGFWTESNGVRKVTAGDPILLDYYGVRYQVFFYCNATGFMASVAVILLLVNQTLSKQGIRSNALHVCVMVGLLGLMGAYATGSCRKLRTSIYVFALVAAVIAFLVLEILFYLYADRRNLSEQPWVPQWLQRLLEPLSSAPMGPDDENDKDKVSASKRLQQKRRRVKYEKRKSLMLLGILAASVTYQAGLAPPGGTWGDDDNAGCVHLRRRQPDPTRHQRGTVPGLFLLQCNVIRRLRRGHHAGAAAHREEEARGAALGDADRRGAGLVGLAGRLRRRQLQRLGNVRVRNSARRRGGRLHHDLRVAIIRRGAGEDFGCTLSLS